MIYAQSVTIGTQVWSTKNLDVSTFRNGDPIPQAKSDEEWSVAMDNQQPAWCYYDNNPSESAKYGKLYNWYAVNDPRGLAPSGWHIPCDVEWTVLDNYLKGDNGNKMKAQLKYETKIYYVEEGGYYDSVWVECSNCKGWSFEYKKKVPCHVCKDNRGKYVNKFIPKTKRKEEERIQVGWDGNNSCGFSGFPGGYRDLLGTFKKIGFDGLWWSSTETKSYEACFYLLRTGSDYMHKLEYHKAFGLSVRCLKD